jgi:hypothetical protein
MYFSLLQKHWESQRSVNELQRDIGEHVSPVTHQPQYCCKGHWGIHTVEPKLSHPKEKKHKVTINKNVDFNSNI